MRTTISLAACLWILSASSPALAGEAVSASVRKGEHLRVEASELRQRAETLRSEGNRGKANELGRRADALDEQANRSDPPNWPPK